MSTPSYEALRDKAVKLETVNRDLLAALKRIRKRAETDPTNLPVKMFAGEIVAMCTDAIYAAEPPITS